jgi:hypothetical protein
MVCRPEAAPKGTANLIVTLPCISVLESSSVDGLSQETSTGSNGPKPYPFTVTLLPTGPEVGFTVNCGVISNGAAPILPLVWPTPRKNRGP